MASSSSNNSQKHGGSKSMEMEEIIRYMSNLPSYLERGKPIQDRALTFGVLDWGRLEQWQYHQKKQGVNTSKKYSSSSRGQSSTASLKPHHVTLQSHLNISPEVISTKYGSVNHSSDQKSTNRSRTQQRDCIKNDLNPQNLLESKSSEDMGSFHTASSSSSSSKGKLKIQDELVIAIGNLQDSRDDVSKSFSFEKDSQNEANSKRNPSATCEIRTPEEKESGVSLKNSDFKTGTVAARKHRFSFSMSSKSADTKSATKTVESPEDSKIKVKVKMDLRNCKDVRVDHSCRNKMNDTSLSKKQALFQMAVKNGRPLFTFSIDNNKDILAATVRSLTAKDDTKSWVYTFFTIHEVKKKKGGWFHHGTKDRGHGYLPNVTAQMKVTNPSNSNCTSREFVLYSVDSGQTDHQMLDAQPENELAAIVVRFARKEDEEENQDCFNMTVILAGGHHGVPRKGEPSPLIERWRSGGRCDCGGWDVGCRLRTFTNKVQCDRRSKPPENFHLFFQEDVINERPFFSLSPLKEGIFSVEYDSSLPLQHAFSICISVIECRKSSHQTELKTYVAKQVIDDDGDDDDDYEAPVTYASLPPVSPVERV